ncbi:MAG: ABC transporter ATP-binding protein [Clostridia bacterium]|nr:ABC transporter ATP-binding protein [Clostridia bacterium]MBR0026489.1 ABC transporter ATP-binding protein [Clostridia bacterium]
MLAVNDLTKKYAKTLANDHLTFAAPAGEITVLLGPNGAGKSTAIKAIAGLLRFSGEIRIGGYPNKSVDAKRILGYVPEMPAAYPMLSIDEHMQFIAKAYSLAEGWEQRADALLDRFELADKRDKIGKELSKGMQQKLSLCCALLPQPKLLLVDEPMVGLDPHAIKELKQLFREERDGGAAVVISTHLLDSVEDLWDRTLIMDNGRIIAERTRKEVEERGESLQELFFEITEHREARDQ